MPSILNIANISNENKISPKTKLNVGDKFCAKLVKDSETGEFKVKLRDGVKVPVEIEENTKFIEKDKLIKFEIRGFHDGKLKLKVLNSETNNLEKQEKEIQAFIKNQGLSEEDVDIVKSMIKHNMKLSKTEILKVRTLLKFKDDFKENKGEINKFINSFLNSKGINKESKEGQNIVKALNNFFKKLSNLTSKDLLTMLENNIEFNNDSIDSFLKVTKDDGQAFKALEKVLKIKNQQKNSEITKQPNINVLEIEEKALALKNEAVSDIGELKKEEINYIDSSVKNQESEIAKSRIQGNLKDTENPKIKDNMIKNLLKTILLNKNSEGNLKDPIKILTNLRGLTEEKIVNSIEDLCKELNLPLSKINESEISDTFSFLLGGNIVLKEEEVKNIKTIFNDILGKDINIEENNFKKQINVVSKDNKYNTEINSKEAEQTSINKENKNIEKENLEINTFKNLKSLKILPKDVISLKNNAINIENQLKEKCSEIKNLVKELINKGENIALNIPKEIVSDLKVLNSLNNNYYMLDLPLKLNQRELECKLMIKDDRKSGKKIDSKNVKLVVTIDTINIGKIDGYLKVIDHNLSIDLKCNEKWIKPISLGKEVLSKSLNAMGYNVNISVTKKIEETNISTCREFFNDKSILVLDRIV